MPVHIDPVLVTLQRRFGHLTYDNQPTLDAETIRDLINRLGKQDQNVDMILSEQSIRIIKSQMSCDPKNRTEQESWPQECEDTNGTICDVMPQNKENAEIPSAYRSPVLNDYIEKLTAHEEYWADVMKERADQSQQNLKLKYLLHMQNLREKMEKLARDRSMDESRESFNEVNCVVDESPEKIKILVLPGETLTAEIKTEHHAQEKREEQQSHELHPSKTQEVPSVSEKQESFNKLSAALDRLIGSFEETMKSPNIQRLNSNLKQKALQVFDLINHKHFDTKSKFSINATSEALYTLEELNVQLRKLINFMTDEAKKVGQNVNVKIPNGSLAQPITFKFQMDKSATHRTCISSPVASTSKTNLSVTSSSTPKKEAVNFSFKLKDSTPEVPEIYADAVTPVDYKEFCNALKVLDQLESIVEGFIRQPSAKNAILIITQSVTNLVNQIAGANFLSSFARMVKLLRGDQIEISRRCVCLKNNPAARSFCINFMCKRILQGVVNNLKQSDSPSSVYNFAAFCVGICSYFPDVQSILLAHIYLKCPMLVPMYVKTVEKSGTEGKSLEAIKNTVELDDEGRPKLTGQDLQPIVAYAQFYATLFVVPPPQNKISSFDIQTLWNLLQSIVRLTPRFQYTAIVLNEVLKNAGFVLWPKFGSLFQDFLKMTRDDFVPKIESVNQGFNVGAFVDLKRYFESADFKKRPHGYLGASIWIPPRPTSPPSHVYDYR